MGKRSEPKRRLPAKTLLANELLEIERHRERALELLAYLRDATHARRGSRLRPYGEQNLLDISLLVFVRASVEPCSFNEVYEAMKLKGLSDGRARMSARMSRLEASGALQSIRGGRGGGRLWSAPSRPSLAALDIVGAPLV